ncbi:MAG TPA: PH domain-containing protein [Acidimicrobiales bacterium]
MPFPRKLLNPGEEIVVDLHPHWFYFLEPGFTVAGALIVAFLVTFIWDVTFLTWIAVPALIVAVLWTAWRFLNWNSIHFVITTDRVIYRSGVVAKSGIQIPIERVNNVLFHQGLLERLFGAGDLMVESAGESGQQRFSDINHPDQVQNLIYAQMDKSEDDRIGKLRSAAASGDAAAVDVAGQLEKLEGLLSRGTITQQEFTLQKQKLLGTLPPPSA